MIKHKAICPQCKGNGFQYLADSTWTEVKQCETCNSEGEIDVEEPTIEELEAARRMQ
jgi:DnaJ-class molecular chaperone